MGAPTGTWLRFLLPGLLLALVLVSGCSGDPVEGAKVPPRAPPTSTSASPTPDTPEEQIKATMEAYFAAANEMFKSGDPTELRTFSTEGCPCRKITNSVAKVYRAGGSYESTRYIVEEIRVHDVVGKTGLAEVTGRVPPYRVLDGNGRVIEDSPGGPLHTDFSLVDEGDRWIIGNATNLG